MTYYIKGGSRYNEANPKVWVALFLGGFPDADYLLTDWLNLDDKGHETDDDPFWRMGGSAGGAKELEIGLWNDFRIKFETTGITYWDGDSWEDLLGLGSIWTDVAANNYYITQDSIIIMKTGYSNADLQAAIDYLVDTADKGTIYLPAGDCTITSQLQLDGNGINLIGSGWETNLINGLTSDYIMDMSASNCTVSYLKISTTATANHGIEISGSQNMIHRCWINQATHGNGNGVLISGGNDAFISYCYINSFGTGVRCSTGIFQRVTHCYFGDCDYGVVYYTGCTNSMINNCVCIAIDAYCYYIQGDNNIVSCCFAGTGGGIYIHADADKTIIDTCRCVAISDNGTNTVLGDNRT